MRTLEDFENMSYPDLCDAVRTMTAEERKADLEDPTGTRSNTPLSSLILDRTGEWMRRPK